jgi:hypothetical protein
MLLVGEAEFSMDRRAYHCVPTPCPAFSGLLLPHVTGVRVVGAERCSAR